MWIMSFEVAEYQSLAIAFQSCGHHAFRWSFNFPCIQGPTPLLRLVKQYIEVGSKCGFSKSTGTE